MINILPLPYLDGSELTRTILNQMFKYHIIKKSYDQNEIEIGPSSSISYNNVNYKPQENHLMNVIHIITLSLLISSLGGSLLLHFIDSTI